GLDAVFVAHDFHHPLRLALKRLLPTRLDRRQPLRALLVVGVAAGQLAGLLAGVLSGQPRRPRLTAGYLHDHHPPRRVRPPHGHRPHDRPKPKSEPEAAMPAEEEVVVVALEPPDVHDG